MPSKSNWSDTRSGFAWHVQVTAAEKKETDKLLASDTGTHSLCASYSWAGQLALAYQESQLPRKMGLGAKRGESALAI